MSSTDTAVARSGTTPTGLGRVGRFFANLDANSATVLVGCLLIAFFILYAFFGWLPYDPLAPDSVNALSPPSAEHWFGTDTLGRDVFSRVVASARTDLPLALGGTAVALLVGVAVALVVSVKSRWSERLVRGFDMFQAFPALILAIALVALAGNEIWTVVLAITLIFAPLFIRLIHAEALSLRESRFIEAATAVGMKRSRILTRHLLPNMTGIILVQTAITASRSLLLISALSFLGIGFMPPTPSWSAMVEEGSQQIIAGNWWTVFFPSLAIFVCVMIFNLIGDALEVILGRGARG